jgi:hypothetical protein
MFLTYYDGPMKWKGSSKKFERIKVNAWEKWVLLLAIIIFFSAMTQMAIEAIAL